MFDTGLEPMTSVVEWRRLDDSHQSPYHFGNRIVLKDIVKKKRSTFYINVFYLNSENIVTLQKWWPWRHVLPFWWLIFMNFFHAVKIAIKQ